jgi:hypothetical protein
MSKRPPIRYGACPPLVLGFLRMYVSGTYISLRHTANHVPGVGQTSRATNQSPHITGNPSFGLRADMKTWYLCRAVYIRA